MWKFARFTFIHSRQATAAPFSDGCNETYEELKLVLAHMRKSYMHVKPFRVFWRKEEIQFCTFHRRYEECETLNAMKNMRLVKINY